MAALAERSCTPCRGGVRPLTVSQCASYLAELPDWEFRNEGRTIARRFRHPETAHVAQVQGLAGWMSGLGGHILASVTRPRSPVIFVRPSLKC
jgi:4a-hydroxytetrahydrobiopterin dehydratase